MSTIRTATNVIRADEVRALLNYDPENGSFTWVPARKGTRGRGQEAGTVNSNGYVQICIGGRIHLAHRLAWLYVHGEYPPTGLQIDHINGDRSDNRITNLRLATNGQNMANRRIQKHNTSGVKGVCWFKPYGKWRVRVKDNGRERHIGYFDRIEDAAAAYREAAAKYHGEFARVE